jgi:phosphomethylpyrimidine synthase
VQGSRPDIRVPMREISQTSTHTNAGEESNPPIYVYDCSGPYTDPAAKIDIRSGLPKCGPLDRRAQRHRTVDTSFLPNTVNNV